LEKILAAGQTKSEQARIAASNSRKAVSFFIRTHKETLAVAVMRVWNPGRSLVGITGRHAASMPSHFAEINPIENYLSSWRDLNPRPVAAATALL